MMIPPTSSRRRPVSTVVVVCADRFATLWLIADAFPYSGSAMVAHIDIVEGRFLAKRVGGKVPVRTSAASCID
jgi:hypothetical protein